MSYGRLDLDRDLKKELSASYEGLKLLDIINNRRITPYFQPIINVKTRKIFSFEALSRGPKDTDFFSPLNLFNTAIKYGCLYEMDLLARKIAIEEFSNKKNEHNNQAKLFLNVSAFSIESNNHETGLTLDFLDAYNIDPEQVVIEITELQPIKTPKTFFNAINHYREMGFKVAIDDLGSGYNGLKLWTDVKPDFVKIDKHFIDSIDTNIDSYRFMETVMTLANSLGTKIIAEGVETEEQLKVLEKLKVDYVQGFLFKHPSPCLRLEYDYEWKKIGISPLVPKETVGAIVEDKDIFSLDVSVNDAVEFFLANTSAEYLPVVAEGNLIGMVWRKEIMDVLASKFGRDLYLRKNIVEIMDENPLVFDKSVTLVEASRRITENGSLDKAVFVVTENDKYLGCGTFMALLRVITDLKIKNAQYSNPLSGLPGNVPIQNTVQECLNRNEFFTIIYVDVDNFKPYNDNYSFEEGDKIIGLVSSILQTVVGENDFVGHIGGDDFVIISFLENYKEVCEKILDLFQKKIVDFYSAEDVAFGGINAYDRTGNKIFFPFMSLSLGVLVAYPDCYTHTQQISSIATKAKKGAKNLGGNTYFVVDSCKSQIHR